MRCFVLIDLKTDDLTHQDLGQMQMYVNYYTRELMNEGDNPPIGIVLCARLPNLNAIPSRALSLSGMLDRPVVRLSARSSVIVRPQKSPRVPR